jgi:hypothetical protein
MVMLVLTRAVWHIGVVAELQESLVQMLLSRRAKDGGFGPYDGEPARADTTAWALFALSAAHQPTRAEDWTFLQSRQEPNGAVSLAPEGSRSVWVTTVAFLAWHTARSNPEAEKRALENLLIQAGNKRTEIQQDRAVIGHDANIRGWPWIENTHVWVDTTALGMVALRCAGCRDDLDGKMLLLDRQLPSGGWNYGNSFVYGQELRPTPESTGIALFALAGEVDAREVGPSLAYAEQLGADASTPLTAAWIALALQAWGKMDLPAAGQVLKRTGLEDPYRAERMPVEWAALLLLAGIGWRAA